MKGNWTGSRSGPLVSLWWQSATNCWLQQGKRRHVLLNGKLYNDLFIFYFLCSLQRQRNPVLRSLHSDPLLSDQCNGNNTFDFKLQVGLNIFIIYYNLSCKLHRWANRWQFVCSSQLHQPWWIFYSVWRHWGKNQTKFSINCSLMNPGGEVKNPEVFNIHFFFYL